jgi:hypothetical protein
MLSVGLIVAMGAGIGVGVLIERVTRTSPSPKIINVQSWALPSHIMNMDKGVFHTINETLKTCSSDTLMLSTLKYDSTKPPVMLAAELLSGNPTFDMTWMANGYFYAAGPSERIITAEMTNIPRPFKNSNAASLSYAYQKVWNDFGLEAIENKTLKYLTHFAHGPTTFGSDVQISSVSDFANMNVRAGGKVLPYVLNKFDINSTHTTAPPAIPAAIRNGIINSMGFSFEAAGIFGGLLDY